MPTSLNALSRSILAGACAVTFCNPIWVIKTRLQLQTDVDPELISFLNVNTENFHFRIVILNQHVEGFLMIYAKKNVRFKNYNGLFDAVRRIYREEGARAFLRGLSISYLGLVETAIQFTW